MASESAHISPADYYGNYHGQTLEHLRHVAATLGITPPREDGSAPPDRPRVLWLAGDSSLDNKAWILTRAKKPAVNGMERVLRPAQSVADVAHWLNVCAVRDRETRRRGAGEGSESTAGKEADAGEDDAMTGSGRGARGSGRATASGKREATTRPSDTRPWVVVNTAVEESTLGTRQRGVIGWMMGSDPLLEQDRFLRDHLCPDDAVCVSAGGNDVALRPTPSTIANMLMMVRWGSVDTISKGEAWGTRHFMSLFGSDMQTYVDLLTAKVQPSVVGVCSIYFPDERTTGSWADSTLGALSYNTEPAKLQAAIRMIHDRATSTVRAKGEHTRTVPIALGDVLDGKTTGDYVARVEPSVSGGRTMANHIWRELRLDGTAAAAAAAASGGGGGAVGADSGAGAGAGAPSGGGGALDEGGNGKSE